MTVKSLELLIDGFFHLDMGMLVWMKPQYYGKLYRCALKSLLVLTEDERILVDTGCGEMDEEWMKIKRVEKDGDLIKELEKRDLVPEDITMVINTHLHFDHCGWNKVFKNAKLVVQKQELVYAHEPYRFQQGGFNKEHFEGLEFDIVDGDTDLCEGVRVMATPGHTPGHQSVVIDIEDKTYIFCGDCGPLKENIERRNVIGITTDPVQCLASIDRLRALEGTYIFAHDNTQLTLD
jgi:glyoxylase-like metal-dependent hydrolase (beta-lactamase superfamily II)